MFTCGPGFFVAAGLITPPNIPITILLGLDLAFRGQPYVVVSNGPLTNGLDIAFRGYPFNI